jgi:glycerol kinase
MEASLKVTSVTNLPSQFVLALDQGTSSARAALEAIAFQSVDVLSAMQMDSGESLRELRVDGGAASNNRLQKFQSDVLDVPVVRPQITETTALGAACLASLAVGFWQDEAELSTLWRAGRRFEPTISTGCRAVERSRHWAQAE